MMVALHVGAPMAENLEQVSTDGGTLRAELEEGFKWWLGRTPALTSSN